jgi:hypothetical protein
MNKGGFSWSRLLGITRDKQQIDRDLGFPVWTQQGRDAFVGRKLRELLTGRPARRRRR